MAIRQVSAYGDLECAWHVVTVLYVPDVIVLPGRWGPCFSYLILD